MQSKTYQKHKAICLTQIKSTTYLVAIKEVECLGGLAGKTLDLRLETFGSVLHPYLTEGTYIMKIVGDGNGARFFGWLSFI